MPDIFNKSRQILRSRLQVMTFIAVYSFKQPAAEAIIHCLVLRSLPANTPGCAEISASWWSIALIYSSAALHPVMMRLSKECWPCCESGSITNGVIQGCKHRSISSIDYVKIDLQNELSRMIVPVPQSLKRI
ncbi:hypothetical protein HV281_17995 [Escherichia coli]|nr:hypothetical protein [Escherichia coli]